MVTRAQIDKSSPIPLYHQLRGVLEGLIRNEQFKPGDSIPGENELCDLYGVSRTTVRQTIREMIQDGLLYRDQTRGRPLVAPVVVRQSLLRLRGFFTEGMLTAKLQPSTLVISTQKQAYPDVSEKMGFSDVMVFYRIERIHCGDSVPLVYQVSYIPEYVCPNLGKLNLEESLFTHIESECGLTIAKAKQVISIRHSDKRLGELMQLPHRLPMYKVERLSFTNDGRAVEYFECLLRGDRYEFEMELDWESDKEKLNDDSISKEIF